MEKKNYAKLIFENDLFNSSDFYESVRLQMNKW